MGFVTLGEGIDTGTPAGKLQLHILLAIAEFERERVTERARAGLRHAKAEGVKLGRRTAALPLERLATAADLSLTEGA